MNLADTSDRASFRPHRDAVGTTATSHSYRKPPRRARPTSAPLREAVAGHVAAAPSFHASDATCERPNSASVMPTARSSIAPAGPRFFLSPAVTSWLRGRFSALWVGPFRQATTPPLHHPRDSRGPRDRGAARCDRATPRVNASDVSVALAPGSEVRDDHASTARRTRFQCRAILRAEHPDDLSSRITGLGTTSTDIAFPHDHTHPITTGAAPEPREAALRGPARRAASSGALVANANLVTTDSRVRRRLSLAPETLAFQARPLADNRLDALAPIQSRGRSSTSARRATSAPRIPTALGPYSSRARAASPQVSRDGPRVRRSPSRYLGPPHDDPQRPFDVSSWVVPSTALAPPGFPASGAPPAFRCSNCARRSAARPPPPFSRGPAFKISRCRTSVEPDPARDRAEPRPSRATLPPASTAERLLAPYPRDGRAACTPLQRPAATTADRSVLTSRPTPRRFSAWDAWLGGPACPRARALLDTIPPALGSLKPADLVYQRGSRVAVAAPPRAAGRGRDVDAPVSPEHRPRPPHDGSRRADQGVLSVRALSA